MIIHKIHLVTRIPIKAPRYKKGKDKWEALVAKYKVDNASPIFIVEWTEAKHLQGVRSCMRRVDAQSYPIEKNGQKRTAIDCYVIPVDDFEPYETAAEIREIADSLFRDD